MREKKRFHPGSHTKHHQPGSHTKEESLVGEIVRHTDDARRKVNQQLINFHVFSYEIDEQETEYTLSLNNYHTEVRVSTCLCIHFESTDQE